MNKLSLLLLFNILYPLLSFSMEKIPGIDELRATPEWRRYENPRGGKKLIGPILNLPLVKESINPELIRFIQAEILNFTVRLSRDKFNPLALETYFALNDIKSEGLRNEIINLGNRIPDNPNVIHAQIELQHLGRPEARRMLIETIRELPLEQKNSLIPQIQAYIIKLNIEEFDPPSIQTQTVAEKVKPYPFIQELLYQLGEQGDDRALKIVIRAQHILENHYLEKPDKTAIPLTINSDNDFIYNKKNGKTVFSAPEQNLISMIYNAVSREKPIATEKDPEGVKNLYLALGTKAFEVVMNPQEEYVKTAYPIFIYHDLNEGDLSLILEKLMGSITTRLPLTLNKDTLIDLAQKSLENSMKNLKYEFTENGATYLIIDIANQILLKNLKPKGIFIPNRGIYLSISKKHFPRAKFPHLYEAEAAPENGKAEAEQIKEYEKEFPALGGGK